jgi:hypothetical protein
MAFNTQSLVNKTIDKFKFRGVDPGTHGLPIITNAINDAYEAGKAEGNSRENDRYYVRKSELADKLSSFKNRLDHQIDELTELYQEMDEAYDDLAY